MSGHAPELVTSRLRSVVPAGVTVAAAETGHALRPLTEQESRATTGMAPRRLLEFTAGRSCAREALALLGIPSDGVPVGSQREPLWPPGVVGSISHTRELAVAVVAPATRLLAIGVDIEPALPLEQSLMSRVCRPTELARLQRSPDAGFRAKMLFSAKESVYKCLWPSTRQFLEFSDVEIVPGHSDENFTVTGWGPLREMSCASLVGRIAVVAGHIVTIAYIKAARSTVAAVDS